MLIESSDLPELTLEGGGEVAEGETAIVTIVADQAPDTDTRSTIRYRGVPRPGRTTRLSPGPPSPSRGALGQRGDPNHRR
ncbi:MAG: hypothetical protein Ct9H300mP12_10460 [Acidimicrobiales bacterium]|nr:MAG: hypothetical protein Ct9H300mP12_10460 [Acidimicrobiales bacterium]